MPDSGRLNTRFVCPDCACWVYSLPRGGVVRVRAGTLDDTSWLQPTRHIWTRSPGSPSPRVTRYSKPNRSSDAGLIDTMAPEIDIWRTAPLLIRQHGEDAEIVAAQRVDALWQRVGYEGCAIGLRVKRALGELQVAPPRISSPVEPDKEECIRARKDKITASPRLRFSLHQRRRGSSAIGAPTSFLVAPATVGSLIRQQTFAGSQGRRHHTDRRQGLRPGEPPEGKLDRSKGDKGGEGFGEVLEILDKPPVAPEP